MAQVTVSDFLENLRGIDFESLTDTIIDECHDEIIDLNREDQIFQQGIDSKGKSIGSYAESTQSIFNRNLPSDLKGANKSKGSHYTLFWTGRSYKSFIAFRRGFNLIITSSNGSLASLLSSFSDNIFGLTKENQNKVNWDIIAPKINEKVREKLL